MTETVVSEAKGVKRATEKRAAKRKTKKTEAERSRMDIKEKVLGYYHDLIELGLIPTFDGATVDLHRERPSIVFVPKTETIIEAENGQLLDFLKGQEVQRVLIDAQFPNNAEVLSEISKAGIEVYLLKRTTTLSAFRKSLKNKHDLSIPKNDYNDVVLLSFVKPKFWKQVDWRYIECWNYMALFRDAEKSYRRLERRIETYPKLRQDEEVMSQFKKEEIKNDKHRGKVRPGSSELLSRNQ